MDYQAIGSSEHSLDVQKGPRYASRRLFAPWFPEFDPAHRRAKTFKAWWTRRKTVLLNACIVATLVLLANSIGTIVMFQRHGDLRVFKGHCLTSSHINLGAHMVINILSSMLLGVSNLCMQLLSAPTRAEVDAAHREKQWLDIGVLSIRNLRSIAWPRRIAWGILALASLPIHVVYNSAVINITPQNSYIWAVVAPSFLSGAPYSLATMSATLESRADTLVLGLDRSSHLTQNAVGTSNDPMMYFDYHSRGIARVQHDVVNDGQSFKVLSTFDCLKRYTAFERDASDVILVSTKDALNNSTNVHESRNSLLVLGNQINTWVWVNPKAALWACGVSNSFNCFKPETWNSNAQLITDWNVRGYKIDYCLAKEQYLGDRCELQLELEIMKSKPGEPVIHHKLTNFLTRDSGLRGHLGQMCLHLLYSICLCVG